jgi:hypothetical protein
MLQRRAKLEKGHRLYWEVRRKSARLSERSHTREMLPGWLWEAT